MNLGWVIPYTDYWIVGAFFVRGTNIYASNAYAPFLSTDNGAGWKQLAQIKTVMRLLDASTKCVFAIADMFAPPNGSMIRSTNNGASWDTIALPGSLAIIDTTLFAQHGNGQIDVSTDNGTSWTMVYAGSSPGDSTHHFCSSGNYLFYMTKGNGTSNCLIRKRWTAGTLMYAPDMNFPSSYVPCSAAVADIRTSGTNVFLNYGATYFSTNSGADWSEISLPPGVPSSAPFATVGTNLFVGATGVWRNSLSNALPIQLASFKVAPLNGGVSLTWTTVSETNNYGFYVQRNGVDIAFIAGHGTTLQPHTYSYTDNPPAGQCQYRLRQVDRDGAAVFSESVTLGVGAPGKFALNQNYPDPFNPSTRISFSITKEGPVSLQVYDLLGREVATLVNQSRKPGEYTEQFNGSQTASGVYVYVLRSSEGQLVGRMMLLK